VVKEAEKVVMVPLIKLFEEDKSVVGKVRKLSSRLSRGLRLSQSTRTSLLKVLYIPYFRKYLRSANIWFGGIENSADLNIPASRAGLTQSIIVCFERVWPRDVTRPDAFGYGTSYQDQDFGAKVENFRGLGPQSQGI
jgi:hypothetical protein